MKGREKEFAEKVTERESRQKNKYKRRKQNKSVEKGRNKSGTRKNEKTSNDKCKVEREKILEFGIIN